jgi:serine/threonine protein kinase
MTITLGAELRGYRILSPLGQGGFGKTFLAEDIQAQAPHKLVIKEFSPATQNPESRQIAQDRFLREAAVLLDIGQKHDQIPRLVSYFRHNEDFYLVQEYVEGETLLQVLKREGPLDQEFVLDLLEQVLPVLDFLHSQKIIHRDIKPENIILREKDGKPVLIDFGAVKESVNPMAHGETSRPFSIIVGSPGYMSPEQAAGRPSYASDIYSLGMTAIAMLTGKAPQEFTPNYFTQELNWREYMPSLPFNFLKFIERSVRFNPQDRFSSVQQMRQALKELAVDHEGIHFDNLLNPVTNTQIQAHDELLTQSQIGSHILVLDEDSDPETLDQKFRQLLSRSTRSSADSSGKIFGWSFPSIPTEQIKVPVALFDLPQIRTLRRYGSKLRHLWQQVELGRSGLLILGGTGLVVILSSIHLANSLANAHQQRESLKIAQPLKQQKRFQECVDQLSLLGTTGLLSEVKELLGECHLGIAEDLARQDDLDNAIIQTTFVPANTNGSEMAQRLQKQWSEQLLAKAARLYQQGELQEALELAASLPKASPGWETAQTNMREWQAEWQRNRQAIQAAKTALKNQDWSGVQNQASLVTTPYWQGQAAPLLRQVQGRLGTQPQTAPGASPSPEAVNASAAETVLQAFFGHVSKKEYSAARELLSEAIVSEFNINFYRQFQQISVENLRLEEQTPTNITFIGNNVYTWPDGSQRREQRLFVLAKVDGQLKIIKTQFLRVL